MQRLCDILLAGLALLILSPLLIPIALVLRLTGEGDVFFLQERVGRHGKLFQLLKFATMLRNSPNIGTGTVTLKDDPRVLPVGRILRKTKFNELPQLWNIVRGDMSIVGPRPQTPRCFAAFPPEFRNIITQVKPGLSGLGPIVFRDEEELLAGRHDSLAFYDRVIAPYKAQVEAWYVKHQTMATYFKVIALTIWVVLFPSSTLVWRVFPDLPRPPVELLFGLKCPA
jgi:lipopolysaccharide/colanic/teichoic acid biosynthesis glycosyltransferase